MPSSLIEKLNQPFPEEGRVAKSLLGLVCVSIFVGLFLFIWQPFGLSTREDLGVLSLGFAAVTFFAGLLHEVILRYLLQLKTDVPTWTFGRWMLSVLSLLLLIAIGNFIFMNWISGWQAMNLKSVFSMILNTLLVGIFPVAFYGQLTQNRAAKRFVDTAADIQLSVHDSEADGLKVNIENFEVAANQIRFIEAQQNYVLVHYLDEFGLKKELIRTTFTKLEDLLKDSPIRRCHRSYFVNIEAVEKVEGNAQGLKLSLSGVNDLAIPVSKSYVESTKAAFD